MTTETNGAIQTAQQLRDLTVAVRLERETFGTRKTFTKAQKERTAKEFKAKASEVGGNKRLINKDNELHKMVCMIMSQARTYWMTNTAPFPDDGIRLLRQDKVEEFEQQIDSMKELLAEAVEMLDDDLPNIKEERKTPEGLGELYNDADYPATLKDEYNIKISYPSVRPDPALQQILPEVYQREEQRIQAQFAQVFSLAEAEFQKELSHCVDHMVEKLADGKTFNAKSMKRVNNFFERFKSVGLGSNADLDVLVDTAQKALEGVDVKKLKDQEQTKASLKETLGSVKTILDSMMSDKPQRAVAVDEDDLF